MIIDFLQTIHLQRCKLCKDKDISLFCMIFCIKQILQRENWIVKYLYELQSICVRLNGKYYTSLFLQLFQPFHCSYFMYYNAKIYIKISKIHELHREVMCSNQELYTRMHPWLAGAQYRTTAVVLVYRLISLIGPHCPASTYSSTCPFLSMHFVVHGREKERGNVVGMRRREKERKRGRISYVHACVLTVVGARQSCIICEISTWLSQA